jgi:hypothetical protein
MKTGMPAAARVANRHIVPTMVSQQGMGVRVEGFRV